MRCIIVEDEFKSQQILTDLIQEHAPYLFIAAKCDNVSDAISNIESLKPQIVFLDIELKGESGFEVLDYFQSPEFLVIFTTAYNDYAIKAFKYSALDYLLKPINPKEFKQAVDQINPEKIDKNLLVRQYKLLINFFDNPDDEKKIVLKLSSGNVILFINEIIRIEGDGNYSRLFLENANYTTSKTLKYFEEILSETDFLRTSKKHIINKNHVQKVLKGDNCAVIMTDNSEIEVSRRRKPMLMELLQK